MNIRGYFSHASYNMQRASSHIRRALWHIRNAVLPYKKECPIVLNTLDTDKILDNLIDTQYDILLLQVGNPQKLHHTKVLRFLRELRANRAQYKGHDK